MLRTQGLAHRYGRLTALEGLDLELRAGECLALIGANGSGKSTAVRSIAGLLAPTAGEVRVAGADPHAEPDAERARAALALVPDTPLLYDDLTVAEHLELVGIAHGVGDDELAERIPALLERLGLGDRADFLPRELSRGMRQKAQLACALIRPAQLLVLDEPVVGLDPPSQRLLGELLRGGDGRRRRGAADHAPARLRRRPRRSRGHAPGGRRARPGPVGRRAGAGPHAGLAVTTSADERLADVRRWWRATVPGPPLGQRAEQAYIVALTGAIFGALVYSTAHSALAQVITVRGASVWGPGLVLVGLVVVARWGAYQGPVVFSIGDVGHTLGAPLPRRGLAVRPLARGLAARRGGRRRARRRGARRAQRRRRRARRRPRGRPRGGPGRRGRPRRRRGLGRAGVGPRRARRAAG